MTAAPELDTETGELRIAEPTLSVLVGHTTGQSALLAGVNDTPAELDLLRSAEVLDASDRAHPAVSDALSAIAHPRVCNLELSYRGKAMLGWVDSSTGALLLPATGEDERRRLMSLPVSLVPSALAKVVDLGERPRPEPAAVVHYREGALSGIRRHWQLTVGWAAEDGTAGTRMLEVVDTDGGLWMLRPPEDGTENDEPVAWPTTPTTVWRAIVGVLARRDADETGQQTSTL